MKDIKIDNNFGKKYTKKSLEKRNEEITTYDTDELTKLKLSLAKSHPFYSSLLTYINVYYSDITDTAGIFISKSTLKPIIIINEEFFNKFKFENKLAILEHELWHLINGHITYRNYKELEEDDAKKNLWNIAYDISINQFIRNLPKNCASHKNFGFKENLSCEQYYELLLKNTKIIKIKIIPFGNKLKNNEEDDKSDGENDIGEGEQHNKNNEKYTIEVKGLDTHEGWSSSLSEDEKNELSENLKDILIKVKNNTQSYGKESRDFISKFDEIFENKINWVNELRRFIAKSSSSHRILSLKKRNKRFKLDPYIIPGFKRDRKLNLIVSLDTSGSISDNQFAAFVGELVNLKKLKYNITVIECDTHIKNIYEFNNVLDVTFKGRGGTSFIEPFKWVQEKRPKPDAMIYFTDMQGIFPEKDLIFPTLWVSTTPKSPFWDMASFGDIIYIDPIDC